MVLLLKILFVVCAIDAPCSFGDPEGGVTSSRMDIDDSAFSEQRNIPPFLNHFQTNVQKYLKEHKGRPCALKEMYQFCRKMSDHKGRDVQKAIIDLRCRTHAVIHHGPPGKFTLVDGERTPRTECYQLALWKMLKEDKGLWKNTDISLAMKLSDLDYNLGFPKVFALKTLYKILFNCPCTETAFLRRKSLWQLITKDLRIYTMPYYKRHPEGSKDITSEDMYCLKNCWDAYRYLMFYEEVTLEENAEQTRLFLSKSEGVTLQDIKRHLLREKLCSDSVLWGRIGLLTVCGYTKGLSYKDGRFFMGSTENVSEKKDLLAWLCDLGDEPMDCEDVAFFLHQKGYYYVKPWEVRILVDILSVCERVEPDLPAVVVMDVWEECQNAEDPQSMNDLACLQNKDSALINNSIKCLTELQKKGLLDKIKSGQSIDVIQTFKDALDEDYGENVVRLSSLLSGDCACIPPVSVGILDSVSTPMMICERDAEVLLDPIALSSSPLHTDDNDDLFAPRAKRVCLRAEGTFYDHSVILSPFPPNFNPQKASDTMRRRWVIFSELYSSFDELVLEVHLQALHKQTQDALLEDVVDLIYHGCNIEYYCESGLYRLRGGSRISASQENDKEAFFRFLQDDSFQKMSIARKTYHMYERGHFVPLYKVALWATVMPKGSGKQFSQLTPQKQKMLESLAQKVFSDKIFLQMSMYENFCWCDSDASSEDVCRMSRRDISRVRCSLGLYVEGQEILKNKQKRIRKEGWPFNVVLHETLSKYFDEHKDEPCSEKALLALVSQSAHRDFCRMIAGMRFFDKKNIVHDPGQGTFTLQSHGEREVKRGCFAKIIWRALDDFNLQVSQAADIYLHISDLGYDCLRTDVEDILAMKRIVAGCYNAKARGPKRKSKIFSVVLSEGRLREVDYYTELVNEIVGAADMKCVKRYWSFYNSIMYDQDVVLAQSLKAFLEQKTDGFTLDDVAGHMIAHGMGQDTPAWSCISGLMRSGSSGHIDKKGAGFVWNPDGQEVVARRVGLYDALLAIPEDYDCGMATFCLHKQGYLHINPWDVYRLLDMLVCTGQRKSLPPHATGLPQMNGDAAPEEADRHQWLEDLGVLHSMRCGQSVDLDPVLYDMRWVSEAMPTVKNERQRTHESRDACAMSSADNSVVL